MDVWDLVYCFHHLHVIIRKPGAAVLSETMAEVIEVMIGNAVGPRLILSGLIQGLGAEAAFAVTGYKRFNWWASYDRSTPRLRHLAR